MVLEEATDLLYHGQYEKGIDLIDDYLAGLEDENEIYDDLLITKSRLYYHMGRVDQARYFAKFVLQKDESNEVAKILGIIYDFELGDHIPAREGLNEINSWENIEIDPLRIPQLSWYYYAQGLIYEFDGDLENAKSAFTKSLEFREQLDDLFEMNILHYRIAVLYRKEGLFDQAGIHLRKSLKFSQKLGMSKEIANLSTLLGQELLMSGKYQQAVPLLKDGVSGWKKQGSPFGTIWALGELAIVQYLSGKYNEAINYYEEIIEIAMEIMPPIYLSNHYMNLFRFYLENMRIVEAKSVLDKMKKIAPEDDFSKKRYELALALYTSRSERLSEKLTQKSKFDELEGFEDLDIKISSLLGGIELLLAEYEITSSQVFKDKILEESDEKIEKLMHHIRQQYGITYELHASILRSKLDILRYDLPAAKNLLQKVRNSTSVPLEFKKQLNHLAQNIEQLDWTKNAFEFEKEFHSIPSLKIFLYLLPRTWVSFTELQRNTGLSAGQLSGKMTKLEELGYLFIEKRFVNEKLTTLYSLTVRGFTEFKTYMIKLKELIDLS